MTTEELLSEGRQRGISLQTDVPLAPLTSFKIGGPCRYLVKPKSITEVKQAVELAKTAGIDFFVMGNGSNLLIPDEGYDGMILLTSGLQELSAEGETIRCGAGLSLSKACSFALSHGLAGLEFAWGIPGSVGGAVYMNAGAYGGEISQVLSSCTFLDENGEERTITREELSFSYRTSAFTNTGRVILGAAFTLRPEEAGQIKSRMDDYIKRRTEKQPLEYPSAGSVFKRPQGAFAGALIEQCGLKGYGIGGAQVSEKHAGFIINAGGATCRDVQELIAFIQQTVQKQTGYFLECEVKTLYSHKSEG